MSGPEVSTISTIRQAIGRLVEGHDLTAAEAEHALGEVMEGRATPAQIAGFAVALRMKVETPDEVMGSVQALRSRMIRVSPKTQDLVDTAGTGGDAADTFNISTAAALVAAGAGVKVAKHGNRAVSSRCGSADVMEALGVPVSLPAQTLARAIDEIGFAFLFAAAFHPALGRAAEARRDLGIRTIFNLIGPMANPASARRQVLGLYGLSRLELVATTLEKLGCERALVVHGQGPDGKGFDEVSIFGPTSVAFVEQGKPVRRADLPPEAFGIKGIAEADRARALESLRGGEAHENAAHIRAILAGELGPAREAVVANAAAAIWAGGLVDDLADGAERARDSIDSGRAAAGLARLVSFCSIAALTRPRVDED